MNLARTRRRRECNNPLLDDAVVLFSFPAMAKTRKTAVAVESHASLKFSAINGILLLLGLAAIIGGYVMLAAGSIVGAPLLLVLGYVVLIPLAIIL
jgi:hypothetical protein